MVKVCECCGHPLPPFHDVELELAPQQRKIFAALHAAGQAGIHLNNLIIRVFADDPDGGPTCARESFYVQRAKMQKVLERHGMRIASKSGGFWRIQKYG